MNKYTNRIKKMTIDFSYYQFVSLLKEMDIDISNGEIQNLDLEFIYYFKKIISMVNEKYVVDNKPGTLGHMLIEDALLNKEKITPALSLCFFLEQKQRLGLDEVCNEINFVHLNGGNYNMMIQNNHESGQSNLKINWKHYSNSQSDADEFNYEIMWSLLHELTHVYQLTRTEKTENIFDKLVYYDYKKDDILIKNGGVNSNKYFHQSLLSEFMADEQAHVFMLHLASIHPEYFNDNLIKNKLTSYQNRKNGIYGIYGSNPREAFEKLLIDIKQTQEETKDDPHFSFIQPMLEEIEYLNKKSQPLITELQLQGVSEKGWDSYYSIYLNTLYRFDGNVIIINDQRQNHTMIQEEGPRLFRTNSDNIGKINILIVVLTIIFVLIFFTIIIYV